MKSSALAISVLFVLAACGKEPEPRTVSEFVDDPILLEATMVRCGQDRAATRYDQECINARDAVDRLAAARAKARRDEMEAQSEQKRQALRRAQEAAAAARRRAEEEARRREEAEYYGDFEPLPPQDDAAPDDRAADDQDPDDRVPDRSMEDPQGDVKPDSSRAPAIIDSGPSALTDAEMTAGPGGADSGATDLEAVSEELTRRQDDQQQ